jgi:hypothetical protein
MIKKLLKWMAGRKAGVKGVPVALSDAEVLAGLEVHGDHPVFASVLELSRRAEADAKDLARENVGNHAEMAYYLGAEWAHESFREYLQSSRLEANALALQRAEKREE